MGRIRLVQQAESASEASSNSGVNGERRKDLVRWPEMPRFFINAPLSPL